ncbi:aldehyde dehydrogenase family protein [Crateriforma conspicua]|uniref:2-aminomuconic 6-semialdehyde dehydrogenase n=1 Tax=Crateriforma conspicua TaxID=2527996 RepID=A0A5C5Y2Z2_9PLAN|nr:aldehyde dehydrogenase family protein [Crateriforma conspicua]QDV64719.1 2-aminomuconic 6-semialdehyde dehydrogenase [Crateriforma conspicua]TWT70116.1 2-aminomuconic 6-semialdehyde dehydrogenase [Crateriforma conspicua]
MITLSPLRWGKPYESLEFNDVVHFDTGEPIAKVGTVGGGIVGRDMRKAHKAREALLQLSPEDLIEKCKQAAQLFENADLKVGDSVQTVDDFVHQQSASTGLPEHMCRSNMTKNSFVLSNMDQILDCLTRGLDLSILARGYGEEGRGVTVSFQAQTPVLGAVLPNNSPGVHTLWLPAIPLQVGLALKPGSQEPWTPYRMVAAFMQAGVPAEAFGLYPGGHDAGGAIMTKTPRSMIFGSAQTVAQHAGNPRVQPHGPGFSKILIADDVVDDWEQYLDVMVESVLSNSGRSCINCSGIWASRHTKEIAQALAERLGPVDVRPPADDEAQLAAFTVPAMATGTYAMVQQDLAESGVTDMTASFGEKLIEREHCAYLRPMVVHADSPDRGVAAKEYMFPFVSVVECPESEMLRRIGPTLVGTVLTGNEQLQHDAANCVEIDRLNIGPIPTNRLNWLQPHEGNIIDFLFRSRAYQIAPMPVAAAGA